MDDWGGWQVVVESWLWARTGKGNGRTDPGRGWDWLLTLRQDPNPLLTCYSRLLGSALFS